MGGTPAAAWEGTASRGLLSCFSRVSCDLQDPSGVIGVLSLIGVAWTQVVWA